MLDAREMIAIPEFVLGMTAIRLGAVAMTAVRTGTARGEAALQRGARAVPATGRASVSGCHAFHLGAGVWAVALIIRAPRRSVNSSHAPGGIASMAYAPETGAPLVPGRMDAKGTRRQIDAQWL